MTMQITKVGWTAFDTNGVQIAAHDIAVSPPVTVSADVTPNDLLAKGNASGLYTTLMNDANANPAVSGYVNPIPVTAPVASAAFNGQYGLAAIEYQGYALPQIYLYIRGLTGP
jgi:hypothetical protein